jgi:hypothetical protein
MLDPKVFEDVRRRVDAVATCQDLSDIARDAIAAAGIQEKINEEMAKLQPILALLQVPGANLIALATWIKDFISGVLGPYVRPIETYVGELAILAAEVTATLAAIERKAADLGNCHIDLPPPPYIPIPEIPDPIPDLPDLPGFPQL